MKYYFVDDQGYLTESDPGDYPKGWFDPNDPDSFTTKKEAVKESRKRLKQEISDLLAELNRVEVI